MDQHGLVERARRGDRHAFAELVRASGARLDATARLILRDPDLAQDAVQETLIRAWRSLPGLRDPATFDHWLHSLVAHACIDLVRKRRRRVIEVELAPIHDAAVAATAPRCIADRDQLDRVLARLEPEARAVVVLHFYLDLPLPRVAEDARHPARDGQVPPPSIARRDALRRWRSRRSRPRLRPALGGPVDMTMDRATRSTASCPSCSSNWRPRAPLTTSRPPSSAPRPDPQRPAWTFPGRWLPMDISPVPRRRRAMPVAPARRPGPHRPAASRRRLAVYIGSSTRRAAGSHSVPPERPRGHVSADGDIVSSDPRNGDHDPAHRGPERDSRPVFSPDGSRWRSSGPSTVRSAPAAWSSTDPTVRSRAGDAASRSVDRRLPGQFRRTAAICRRRRDRGRGSHPVLRRSMLGRSRVLDVVLTGHDDVETPGLSPARWRR